MDDDVGVAGDLALDPVGGVDLDRAVVGVVELDRAGDEPGEVDAAAARGAAPRRESARPLAVTVPASPLTTSIEPPSTPATVTVPALWFSMVSSRSTVRMTRGVWLGSMSPSPSKPITSTPSSRLA